MADRTTVALTCNSCGAGLNIDDEVRFLTCAHCGARLEVKHTADAVYTTVLEKVAQVERVAEETAADLEVMKKERELEKVEHELAQLQDKNPGGFGLIIMLASFAALGAAGFALSSDNEIRGSGLAAVLVCGGLALWLGWGLSQRMREFQAERIRLHAHHDGVREQLQQARQRAAAAPKT